MIKEIVNFTKELTPSSFSKNLELTEGLYLLIDENTNHLENADIILYSEKSEPQQIHKELLDLSINTVPVSQNKSFNPIKKVFITTCSPFSIGFKKKNFQKHNDKILKTSIAEYFNGASNYIGENDDYVKWYNTFKSFCEEKLIEGIKEIEDYKKLKADGLVFVFFKPPTIEDYKIVHKNYLSAKVFNKDDYNVQVDGITYGISDNLSTFQEKKLFLQHRTAPFEYSIRLTGKDAQLIWKFYELKKNKQLPNPIPIFIDKEELNQETVRVFNENRKIKYAEMIKLLIQENKNNDLSNYYLLYFVGRNLVDLDFVPLFRYEIDDMKMEMVFNLGDNWIRDKKKISNVFEFERTVANTIFNKKLIPKNGLWLRYFDDISYDKYMSANTFQQLLRYRKSFYDYIYKSKIEAISQEMFDDIMIKGILEDIRSDKEEKNGYKIKEKLNIWFSLYNYFINKQQKREDMVNQTELLYNKLREIAKQDNTKRIKETKEFAFSCGQLINYLLRKSETANRTHALLEPFLQKTDANQLKLAIARTFDTYKHAITLYGQKYEFDKVMSEVMGFETDENMKSYLPYILAGYFSDSIFRKQDKD